MKYDLETMNYDPDGTDVVEMFYWKETPEGFDYWDGAYDFYNDYGYHHPDVQEKLDAMRKQWEGEQKPRDFWINDYYVFDTKEAADRWYDPRDTIHVREVKE